MRELLDAGHTRVDLHFPCGARTLGQRLPDESRMGVPGRACHVGRDLQDPETQGITEHALQKGGHTLEMRRVHLPGRKPRHG